MLGHFDSKSKIRKALSLQQRGSTSETALAPFARPAACNRACLWSVNGGQPQQNMKPGWVLCVLVLALLRGAAALRKDQCTGATDGGLPGGCALYFCKTHASKLKPRQRREGCDAQSRTAGASRSRCATRCITQPPQCCAGRKYCTSSCRIDAQHIIQVLICDALSPDLGETVTTEASPFDDLYYLPPNREVLLLQRSKARHRPTFSS